MGIAGRRPRNAVGWGDVWLLQCGCGIFPSTFAVSVEVVAVEVVESKAVSVEIGIEAVESEAVSTEPAEAESIVAWTTAAQTD